MKKKSAVHKLGPKRLHEMSATVWTRNSLPQSCVLDGIQVSSGCTFGKRNITVKESAQERTRVEFRKGGRTIAMIAVRNTTAQYHAMPTRHTPIRLKGSRRPTFPSISATITTPETLGPEAPTRTSIDPGATGILRIATGPRISKK